MRLLFLSTSLFAFSRIRHLLERIDVAHVGADSCRPWSRDPLRKQSHQQTIPAGGGDDRYHVVHT